MADDVIVSGSTQYDHNDAALAALFKEWNRATLSYSARVADLMNGGGLNGSTVLNRTTVAADSTGSILVGAPGTDWFLFNTKDQILDRAGGEIATPLWATAPAAIPLQTVPAAHGNSGAHGNSAASGNAATPGNSAAGHAAAMIAAISHHHGHKK